MKILMVSPSYFPIVGGTETVVRNLSMKLNEIGVPTDVMTFNMNKKWYPILKEETKEEGFKVFRVPAFNPFSNCAINPLRISFKVNVIPHLKFAKRFKDYDIIHFHDDVDLSFPLFSCFTRKPKILHCHTIVSTYRYYKRNVFSRNILKKMVDFYVSCSVSLSKLLLDLGLPESRILTLHNGVNTERFRPDKTEKLDNSILFVGRMERRKGLHVLLEALSFLETKTKLIIIGPSSNSKYSSEIKNMVEKMRKTGIPEVTNLGYVSEDTLINWYQKVSVFVCPSISDIFPTVVPQALACGTPVIGTSVGGIPEIVKDGVNGILVPPNNSDELANALKKLLEDQELRELFGKEGRRIVEQYFSWNHIAKELIKIYEKILVH